LQAADGGGLRKQQPSLEAQLANLADEIAYNAHDIDDGVRSGLLRMEQLEDVELFSHYRRETSLAYPLLQGRRLLFETIRRMLSAQVYNVIDATRQGLEKLGASDVEEVRQLPPLICFGSDMAAQSAVLKQFLLRNLYRHPQVSETTEAAKLVVRELFAAYMADPSQMPQAHIDRFDGIDMPHSAGAKPERVVADYIAGMTDRFASREHERLSGRTAFSA
jgi:dGTPase